MLNIQGWIYGITEARANEIVQIHQDSFKFDGGVTWASPKAHPSNGTYAIPVHINILPSLSVEEQAAAVDSLPSDWIVQPVMPTE